MPASKRYVLNKKALEGIQRIRDEYSANLVARAMRIDKSTFLRIMQGKPFYMRTGMKIAKALCKDKGKGIPLHCVFHEVEEAKR